MMDFFLWVLLQQYIVYLLALKHPSFGLVSWFLWFGFLSCFFWFGLNIETVEIHVSLKRTSIREVTEVLLRVLELHTVFMRRLHQC